MAEARRRSARPGGGPNARPGFAIEPIADVRRCGAEDGEREAMSARSMSRSLRGVGEEG